MAARLSINKSLSALAWVRDGRVDIINGLVKPLFLVEHGHPRRAGLDPLRAALHAGGVIGGPSGRSQGGPALQPPHQSDRQPAQHRQQADRHQLQTHHQPPRKWTRYLPQKKVVLHAVLPGKLHHRRCPRPAARRRTPGLRVFRHGPVQPDPETIDQHGQNQHRGGIAISDSQLPQPLHRRPPLRKIPGITLGPHQKLQLPRGSPPLPQTVPQNIRYQALQAEESV